MASHPPRASTRYEGGGSSTARAYGYITPQPSSPAAESERRISDETERPASAEAENVMRLREVLRESMSIHWPGAWDRDDYDIFWLAQGHPDTPLDAHAWVDFKLMEETGESDRRRAIERIAAARERAGCPDLTFLMDEKVEVTGLKPPPRTSDSHVHIRRIPGTSYGVRLWPGVQAEREYCMDFVSYDNRTFGEPVNSDKAFGDDIEVWSAPPRGQAFWLGVGARMRLFSLERNFGIAQKDILPGQEKWVLKEGMTCVLVHRGRTIVFQVPIRGDESSYYDVDYTDELAFPTYASTT